MSPPTDAHVNAARKLLADARVSSDGAHASSAVRVYTTLFDTLSPVIGEVGFRALFERSVKISGRLSPQPLILSKVRQPKEAADRVALHFVDCLAKLEPQAAEKAAVALFATLFGLVANLIGEPLLWQLVNSTRGGSADAERSSGKDSAR